MSVWRRLFQWFGRRPERETRFLITNMAAVEGDENPNFWPSIEDALPDFGAFVSQIRTDKGYMDMTIFEGDNEDADTVVDEVTQFLMAQGLKLAAPPITLYPK